MNAGSHPRYKNRLQLMEIAEKIRLTHTRIARLDAGLPARLPATEEEFLDFWPPRTTKLNTTVINFLSRY